MPVPNILGLGPEPDFTDVVKKINQLVQQIRELLLTLDDANFDKITANVLDVQELSAITANLGHITAGLIEAVTIVGSLIKTAESGQRVELSSTENLLKAINAAGNYVNIVPDFAGSPAFYFNNGLAQWFMYMTGTTFAINSVGSASIQLSSTSGDIQLSVGSGRQLRVPGWEKVYNYESGQNLQTVLDYKAALIHYHTISEISGLSSTLSNIEARLSALESSA